MRPSPAGGPQAAPRGLSGVRTRFVDLVALRRLARQLNLNKRVRGHRMLGARRARMSGRGMEFEEVRAYQPGDDARAIDWRVTARLSEPHTKLFHEERERPAIIMLDLRAGMCFGSRRCFKSVLATEAGALLAWASLASGDQVGGLVVGRELGEVRPRRHRREALRLLRLANAQNNALDMDERGAWPGLADAARGLRRIAATGSTVYAISDFRDIDDEASEQLSLLCRHAKLIALHVSDPLERELPTGGDYAFSDGRERLNLNTAGTLLRERFRKRMDAALDQLDKLPITVLRMDTATETLAQLQRYWGRR